MYNINIKDTILTSDLWCQESGERRTVCGGDGGGVMEVVTTHQHCDLRLQHLSTRDQGYYMCMITGTHFNQK